MEGKAIVIILIPLIALAMILVWMGLLARAGRPIKINLSGFGVRINLDAGVSEHPPKGN